MLELLKDMKKIKEDAKSVTMSHPKGHSIVLVLKGLPMIQREAIKRLPLYDGGEVKGVHKSAYDSEDKQLQGESEAGKQVRQSDLKSGANGRAKDEHKKVLDEMKSMPNPKIQNFDEGGTPQADNSDSSDSKPPVVVNVGAQQPPSIAAQQAATPVNVQQPAVGTGTPNVLNPNGSANPTAVAQVAQQANQGQAKIDATRAQAMAPIVQSKIQGDAALAQRDQDNINMLTTHADNLAKNLKDINPNAAWDNMSAPKKVSTALGLFLGGMSVPFGGHNFSADFLNNSLNRDVDAQVKNNQNQQTIFGAYNTLYGNQNIASNMAKASMADQYLEQAKLVDQKLGTAQSHQNLLKVASDLATIKNQAIRDSAVNLRDLPNYNGNQNSGVGIQPTNSNGSSNGIQNVSAPGSTQPQQQKPPEDTEFKILTPKASDNAYMASLMNPKYHPEIGDQERAKISSQLTQASQAEKSLGGINKLYSDLANEANHGGLSGYFHRQISPNAIGTIGAGVGAIAGKGPGAIAGGTIGEGLGHSLRAITGTNEQVRQYDSDKSALIGYISSALKGTNIGSNAIQDIVDKNAPELNDTPKTIDKKLTAIKHFIIQHTETDALQRHGISYK
jgi:hypothetical protein